MMKIFKVTMAAAAGVLLSASALAQTAYSPGQTFSAGPRPTPAPVQTAPAAEVNLPVYRPVQQTPQSRQSPAKSSSMYNMESKAASTTAKKPTVKKTVTKVQEKEALKPQPKKSTSVETAEDREKPEAEEKATRAKAEVKPEAVEPEVIAKAEPAAKEVAPAAAESKLESTPAAPPVDPANKLVYTNHKTGKKQIALTYDDGPNPQFTTRLMEYLKANNVPATFYVCGNMVKEYPDTVKKLAAEGFELANHSYDHPNLGKMGREAILKQLQDTHDLIKEHSGVDVKTMRPPYGSMNAALKDVCEAMGYKIILWDVDTEDWRKRSTAQMMNTIGKLTGDGSIILMHDRKHGGKDTVLETTQQTVEKYRAQGYEFVTVTQLLNLDSSKSDASNAGAPSPAAAPAVKFHPPMVAPDQVTTGTASIAGGVAVSPAEAPAVILP